MSRKIYFIARPNASHYNHAKLQRQGCDMHLHYVCSVPFTNSKPPSGVRTYFRSISFSERVFLNLNLCPQEVNFLPFLSVPMIHIICRQMGHGLRENLEWFIGSSNSISTV